MLNPYNLVVVLDAALFFVGAATFIVGVLILTLRTSNADVRSLAAQTVRLAQKGIAEDVAGLVGNASDLLESLNQVLRTTRGVGMFLTLLGLLLMGLATYFSILIYQVHSGVA
jgi:hypothetical protein